MRVQVKGSNQRTVKGRYTSQGCKERIVEYFIYAIFGMYLRYIGIEYVE